MKKIRVYPAFNAYYYSFYLQGLHSVFGKKNIVLSCDEFPRFHHHCLAFVVQGNKSKKIYISAGDGPGFNEEGLEWCDIYAKVNIDFNLIPSIYSSKVKAIGPSFSMRIWGLSSTIWHSIHSFALGYPFIDNVREHYARYWRQYRYRFPERAYVPGKSSDNYIFFASSIWKKEHECNKYRAAFIDMCRKLPGIRFEGGFAPRSRKDVSGFDELTMENRYPYEEYIRKMKISAVAFSTPAVTGCLGWKLGESLALGKAIISTPFDRQLPAPLEHGKHIHYVDGSPESIKEAIKFIIQNRGYKGNLERSAREYYLTYLQPTSVVKRLLRMCLIDQ
jgi:glycosyltransferase involved in cell wall biosynthesis